MRRRTKNRYLKYILTLFFLASFQIISAVLADEILTADGEKLEGIIINQSPSDVTVKLKDRTVKFNRSDLKYVKKWPKEKNDVLTEGWKTPAGKDNNLNAREEESRFADSVKYSDQPWEIYEEDAFIAFHHDEGTIRNRLKGRVGDYCKKVAEKLGYDEFKVYDKITSPDWNLKFKFYSYRNFEAWKKALEAKGKDSARVMAFAGGGRRVFFYGLYMREDVIYHEIVHEIYWELTKGASVPNWWNEGIAEFALLTTNDARKHISESRFRALNDKQISLSSGDGSYEHNYEDGLSVVYFLVREKGKDKFKKFNYNLRNKKRFDESLFDVYGFKDIDALEKVWVEYLKKTDIKDMVGD